MECGKCKTGRVVSEVDESGPLYRCMNCGWRKPIEAPVKERNSIEKINAAMDQALSDKRCDAPLLTGRRCPTNRQKGSVYCGRHKKAMEEAVDMALNGKRNQLEEAAKEAPAPAGQVTVIQPGNLTWQEVALLNMKAERKGCEDRIKVSQDRIVALDQAIGIVQSL